MDKWTTALLIIPVLAASLLLASAAWADAEEEPSTPTVPTIESVEYISISSDGTFNKDILVRLGNVSEDDPTMYLFTITRGASIVTNETRMAIPDDPVVIDATHTASHKMKDGAHVLKMTPGRSYSFDMITVELRSNMTAYKDTTFLASTDSMKAYTLPSTYLWNTSSDGTGEWVDSLSKARVVDYTATLYAFSKTGRTVNIVSSTATTVPGGEAKVLVSATSNPGSDSMRITATYDSDALQFVKAENATSMTMNADSSAAGTVKIDLSSNKTARAVGSLVCLTFSVKDSAAAGTYPVTVKCDAASEFHEVPCSSKGCAVIVGETMRGDIDKDSAITAADSAVIKNSIVGNSVSASKSDMDVNGDGRVSALDSLLMKKYMNGDAVVFSDFDTKKTSVTIKDGSSETVIADVTVGSTAHVSAGEKTVKVTADGTEVSTTDLGNGRYSFVVPASRNVLVALS